MNEGELQRYGLRPAKRDLDEIRTMLEKPEQRSNAKTRATAMSNL